MDANRIESMRKSAMSDFEWRIPGKKSTARDGDVVITRRGSSDGKRKYMAISFKDNLHELITPCERMAIAFVKDRMFFKGDPDGYKVSNEGRRNATQIKYSPEIEGFVGEHDLMYDDFLDLYYIKKEKS